MAIKHVKTSEFDEIMDAAPLAMVDFWASWCGPCKMLSPTVEALAEQYEGKALVCKVNVDEEPDLAASYGVESIPTLILFRDGEIDNQMVGVRPKAAIISMIGG